MWNSPIFFISLNLISYCIGLLAQKRIKSVLANPILIAVIFIIVVLKVTDTTYMNYNKNSELISFLLEPAIVCLAIPLYSQVARIRKQFYIILFSSIVACLVGIIGVTIIAKILGAPDNILLSLVPKSVTTPIAMDISKIIGGIPSLTACMVILAGIFGATFGLGILKYTRVKNPIAQGFSMGVSSHVLGASRSMEISNSYGAFATVGLIMNGILTAIFAPYIVQAILWFF